MSFFQEVIKPVIDPSNLQGSTFDTLNYINTLSYNITVISSILVFSFLLWLFYGLGKGISKTKIRLQRANYWFFFVILLVQVLLFIVFYWFPYIFKIFG